MRQGELRSRLLIVGLCLAADVPLSAVLPDVGPINPKDCDRCKYRRERFPGIPADQHCSMFAAPLDFRCVKGVNNQETSSA